MSLIAALGIGGTNFHYAAGTPDGELRTDITTEDTRARNLPAQIGDALEHLETVCSEPVFAVAAACKGLIDPHRGTIDLLAINGGDTIRDLDLASAVEDRYEVPLYLENDCTAAALAEYHYGSQDVDSLIHVTIGTGIGAGIIDRGEIVRGESNFAGEVGGIRVGPDDGLEWCDIPGAWEAYCSGPGILHYVRNQLREEQRDSQLFEIGPTELQTATIFDAAKAGDAVAQEYVDDIARYNAEALGTVSNLFNPGLITLGGGVTLNNEELIVDGVRDHIDDYLVVDPPQIQCTRIDNMGIKGALAQVRHRELSERPRNVSRQSVH